MGIPIVSDFVSNVNKRLFYVDPFESESKIKGTIFRQSLRESSRILTRIFSIYEEKSADLKPSLDVWGHIVPFLFVLLSYCISSKIPLGSEWRIVSFIAFVLTGLGLFSYRNGKISEGMSKIERSQHLGDAHKNLNAFNNLYVAWVLLPLYLFGLPLFALVDLTETTSAFMFFLIYLAHFVNSFKRIREGFRTLYLNLLSEIVETEQQKGNHANLTIYLKGIEKEAKGSYWNSTGKDLRVIVKASKNTRIVMIIPWTLITHLEVKDRWSTNQ